MVMGVAKLVIDSWIHSGWRFMGAILPSTLAHHLRAPVGRPKDTLQGPCFSDTNVGLRLWEKTASSSHFNREIFLNEW